MKKVDFGIDISPIAGRIKQVRGARKQIDFARELDVKLTTYRRYEEGENIPIEFVLLLHKKRNISLEWLLTGEGRPEPEAPAQIRTEPQDDGGTPRAAGPSENRKGGVKQATLCFYPDGTVSIERCHPEMLEEIAQMVAGLRLR